MNINLHIERLIIDGGLVEPHKSAELKAAVALELGQMLTNNSVDLMSQLMGGVRSLDGGEISVGGKHSPSLIGRHVAGAVIRSMGLESK